jgi:hypothetical protein
MNINMASISHVIASEELLIRSRDVKCLAIEIRTYADKLFKAREGEKYGKYKSK